MKIVVLNTASLGIIITSMMDEQSPICRKCIHCTRLGDKPTLLIANEQMTESALISIHPLKSHSLCQINIAIGHGTFTLSFLSAKRSILHSHVKALPEGNDLIIRLSVAPMAWNLSPTSSLLACRKRAVALPGRNAWHGGWPSIYEWESLQIAWWPSPIVPYICITNCVYVYIYIYIYLSLSLSPWI